MQVEKKVSLGWKIHKFWSETFSILFASLFSRRNGEAVRNFCASVEDATGALLLSVFLFRHSIHVDLHQRATRQRIEGLELGRDKSLDLIF